MSRQAVGALMLLSEDMYKLEVEEDGCNPAVYGHVRPHIRVLEHALDVLCVHFFFDWE